MTNFKLRNQLIVKGATLATCFLSSFAWSNPCDIECSPCDNRGCFAAGLDFLYWTVCQRDLDFYISEVNADIDSGHMNITEKLNVADYGWDCGFRAFAGYTMGPGKWEIFGVFTYLNSVASGSTSRSLDTDALKAKNKLNYRVADALISREYELACASILRPFVGFRALWLNQDFKLDAVSDATKDKLRSFDSDLFAAGMHAGLGWEWQICDGFTIFTTGAGSLLQGDVDSSNSFRINSEANPVILKNDECLPVPGYHLSAGLSWETCYQTCGFQNWLRIALGYEFNHWFHVPEFDRTLMLPHLLETSESVVSSSNSSLMLHGITLRADIRF